MVNQKKKYFNCIQNNINRGDLEKPLLDVENFILSVENYFLKVERKLLEMNN